MNGDGVPRPRSVGPALALSWLAIAWMIAWGVARLVAHSRPDPSRSAASVPQTLARGQCPAHPSPATCEGLEQPPKRLSRPWHSHFPVAAVAVRRCRPYFVTVGSSFVAGRLATIDRMGTLPSAHSQVGTLRPARQTQLGASMTRETNAEVAGFTTLATSSSAAPNLDQVRRTGAQR